MRKIANRPNIGDQGINRNDDLHAPALNNKGQQESILNELGLGEFFGRRWQDIFKHDRRYQNRGMDTVEGNPDTTDFGDGSPLVGDHIQSAWDPQADTNRDQTYISNVDWYDGGFGDHYMREGIHDIGVTAGREINMKKEARAVHQEPEHDMSERSEKDMNKELGIVLNKDGMPYIDFRDGSFAEVRGIKKDAKSRHQGIDEGAEYMVVVAYPSLGYENEVGRGGYKKVEDAEGMLRNYAVVHTAKGLTYTY